MASAALTPALSRSRERECGGGQTPRPLAGEGRDPSRQRREGEGASTHRRRFREPSLPPARRWRCSSSLKAGSPANTAASSPRASSSAKYRATVRTCAASFTSSGVPELPRHQRRLDLGEDDASGGIRRGGSTQPVSNGQIRALGGPARIVAQAPHDRDAGQRLAADRAGTGELPARLRSGASSGRSGGARPGRPVSWRR